MRLYRQFEARTTAELSNVRAQFLALWEGDMERMESNRLSILGRTRRESQQWNVIDVFTKY